MDKSPNAKVKKGNKGISRKDNPDYEQKTVNTRDGVKQKVYVKKGSAKPKKNTGTPEKRRGGFKKSKIGLLNSAPTIQSSMASQINPNQYVKEQTEKNAVYNLDLLNRLSGSKREKMQNQFKAPKQVSELKSRSRTNPTTGGGDGRT